MIHAAPPLGRTLHAAPGTLVEAARIARDAARALADESSPHHDPARWSSVADRLTVTIARHWSDRSKLLEASPFLVETSGRVRTLIEMIEAEAGEDAFRVRLANVLLRALVWHPDSFPFERGRRH